MSRIENLRAKFSSESNCLQYLSDLKWKNGYKCQKCGHQEYCKGKKYHWRKCLNCHYDESPTCGTLFHKVKFSLVSAFEIIYWLSSTTKGMSTHEISRHFGIHQTTAWRFKKKVQLATSDSK